MDALVEVDWLRGELEAPDLRVLDCSVANVVHDDSGFGLSGGRGVWAQGHIPGSGHVDLLAELSDRAAPTPLMMPPAEQLRAALLRAGVGDGTRVVLYDNNLNMWAARVWWMLRAVSFDSAAVLNGGWRAWTAADAPVETGDRAATPAGHLSLVPRPGTFAHRDDVLGALGDGSVCLVDALQPEVYRGERRDYARAGHIPGAYNVPFAELVDPDTHRYLPTEQLRARFAAAPVAEADRVLTYCGGGVAASSAAFVLGLLGVPGVAVYDGSLLEWSTDPGLPMVTGAER